MANNKYRYLIPNYAMVANRFAVSYWHKQIDAKKETLDDNLPDGFAWNVYTDYDPDGADLVGDCVDQTFDDYLEYAKSQGMAKHAAWLKAKEMLEDQQYAIDNPGDFVCVCVELLDEYNTRIDFSVTCGFVDDSSLDARYLMAEAANDMKREMLAGVHVMA